MRVFVACLCVCFFWCGGDAFVWGRHWECGTLEDRVQV